ncbi:hypothetical protein BJ508DRAFT_176361 [Ascobolus immersus RN42]|uniref:Uncharacterized protein n=1 Tax=Ascobolus immersus RN42 TaxID=1160509 RepID=A0A3N4IH21_ASCIM|nr:hypothetical protein BJ508DRAFT_176361 [Ascobolus immersus RN42]
MYQGFVGLAHLHPNSPTVGIPAPATLFSLLTYCFSFQLLSFKGGCLEKKAFPSNQLPTIITTSVFLFFRICILRFVVQPFSEIRRTKRLERSVSAVCTECRV